MTMLSDDIAFVIYIVNIMIAILFTYKLILITHQRKGKSLSRTYYIFSLSFILFLSLQVIQLARVLPDYPWGLLEAVTELVFLISVMYMFLLMNRTIRGYEELIEMNRKPPIRDVE